MENIVIISAITIGWCEYGKLVGADNLAVNRITIFYLFFFDEKLISVLLDARIFPSHKLSSFPTVCRIAVRWLVSCNTGKCKVSQKSSNEAVVSPPQNRGNQKLAAETSAIPWATHNIVRKLRHTMKIGVGAHTHTSHTNSYTIANGRKRRWKKRREEKTRRNRSVAKIYLLNFRVVFRSTRARTEQWAMSRNIEHTHTHTFIVHYYLFLFILRKHRRRRRRRWGGRWWWGGRRRRRRKIVIELCWGEEEGKKQKLKPKRYAHTQYQAMFGPQVMRKQQMSLTTAHKRKFGTKRSGSGAAEKKKWWNWKSSLTTTPS